MPEPPARLFHVALARDPVNLRFLFDAARAALAGRDLAGFGSMPNGPTNITRPADNPSPRWPCSAGWKD